MTDKEWIIAYGGTIRPRPEIDAIGVDWPDGFKTAHFLTSQDEAETYKIARQWREDQMRETAA